MAIAVATDVSAAMCVREWNTRLDREDRVIAIRDDVFYVLGVEPSVLRSHPGLASRSIVAVPTPASRPPISRAHLVVFRHHGRIRAAAIGKHSAVIVQPWGQTARPRSLRAWPGEDLPARCTLWLAASDGSSAPGAPAWQVAIEDQDPTDLRMDWPSGPYTDDDDDPALGSPVPTRDQMAALVQIMREFLSFPATVLTPQPVAALGSVAQDDESVRAERTIERRLERLVKAVQDGAEPVGAVAGRVQVAGWLAEHGLITPGALAVIARELDIDLGALDLAQLARAGRA